MNIKRVFVFLTFCGFFAGIAWLAGYDFNQRGPGIAYWTAVSTVVAAFITYAITEDAP